MRSLHTDVTVMFNVRLTSAAMELLPLACLCLLSWSGPTSADEGGPSLTTVAVAEGSDAILPCSFRTKENIEQMVFDWKKDGQEVFLYDAGKHYNQGRTGQDEQFKGRVFHFEEELKHGNASIKVHKTKMADNGSYTCNFPKTNPKFEYHITLVVGAAPEPSVTTLDQTKDWALLRCVVRGAFPKPKVEWQDRAGNILPAKEPEVTERGGSYDIILQTTVTKTNHYRCVSTQEEISHQIYSETYVHISGSSAGEVVTAGVGSLVLSVLLSLLLLF
ncbi:butyrophilin subfamily 2 member A2-like [Xiphias gladius]|uniref:butyrophilin subfamily 2 member A2-like n=1 Tax=Xiphias gladius TaxID=8245 RepID=UPI001A980799|nr:butyrophilin subfamily 2 member A2-like [Xiphias gladius]